ncbi:HD-GYP domain-containing protein [Andreprevotia chitinilytica]|uniref:HD-GYP domain-containing protein n=1 Tax=Andreprevotia chitinilytica TaxID=396808 RepID=UPI0006911BD3|nr:HD-GYP domain-containing protein [Andreprevotia chitinilytica]
MDLLTHLLNSLYTMAAMVEARDAYTGGHLWRVSQFSKLIAQDMGLPDTEVARIALGGFLHDLGKIGVPDAILNKPDKLTDEEYDVIKTHPAMGEHLLANHPLAHLVHDAVVLHHETPDGRGYPRGLTGDAIPLVAKIVGITDAFDAMTSTRPYRKGMPIARALEIIRDNLGRQFDAEIADRFIRMGQAGVLDHIVGHSEPGIPLQSCPMCGPIIAVPKKTRTGDLTACPACRNELRAIGGDGDWRFVPTGRRAPAQPLVIDHELIEGLTQLVRTSLGDKVLQAA